MNYFGQRQIPPVMAIPSHRLSLLLTANSAQAFDYPTATDLVRFSIGSTVASLNGMVFADLTSTAAAAPTTGAVVTTANSSGGILLSGNFDRMYQRPRSSTGFSLISGSSFQICVEFWTRTGSTA